MLSPKEFTLYFVSVLILSAIFLSTCSETSEYGEASDYEKLGASCVNSSGDTSAPTISELIPADNSTNVPVASKIVVEFSDAMLPYSVTTNTADTKCSGSLQLSTDNFSTCIKMTGSPVASDNDTIFTVTPASSLSLQTNYKIKITNSVVENSCNKLATDNTTTNGFTTAGPGSGTINGRIISDVDNSRLSGVNVQFYGTTIDNTTTDSNGDYSANVAVGDYELTYNLDGYLDGTMTVPLETDGQSLTVATYRMLSDDCASTGTMSATVRDAVTGVALGNVNNPGVFLLCRGIYDMFDRACPQLYTGGYFFNNASGVVSFPNIPSGWYSVKCMMDGYIDCSEVHVRSCGDVADQDFALSERLASLKTMRIVLSWLPTSPVTGDDLDSHIQIPDNSSQPWHLHWARNTSGTNDYYAYDTGDNVTLDWDDKNGPPGTETITIWEVRNGTYNYKVHDFSNSDNSSIAASSTNLANSGAKVTVYYNNTITTYDVPSGAGNLWSVFTFTVSGGLVEVGTMSSQHNYNNIFN